MQDYYTQEIANQAQTSGGNNDFYSQEIAPQQTNQFDSSIDNMIGTISSIYSRNMQDNNTSPLHLTESIAYGLADDAGKEKLLRLKFPLVQKQQDGNYAVGTSPQNLQLVDPQGILNDVPTKLAQHLGDINVIGTSILGAILGTAGEPGGGSIAGAAAGGAVGSAVNKGISKALGLNTQSIPEVATDIGIDGALMGAGEGVGQAFNYALKAAGKNMAAKGVDMLGRMVKQGANPQEISKQVSGIAKMLHFTSGWNEEDVITALTQGAQRTFETDGSGAFAGIKKGSDEYLTKLTGLIQNTVKTNEQQLGVNLQSAEAAFRDKVSADYTINSTPLQVNIMKQLQSLELGKLTQDGDVTMFQVAPGLGKDSKDLLKTFAEHFNDLGGTVHYTGMESGHLATGKIPTAFQLNADTKVDMDTLFRRSEELSRNIAKTKDNNLKRVFMNIKNGNVGDVYGEPVTGVTDTIAKVAQDVGDARYIAAKSQFATFKGLLDNATKAGLDFSEPLSIQSKIESGLTKNALLRNIVQEVDSRQKTNFLNQMAMWKSARSAQTAMPNMLRFGMVMSLAGLGALRAEGAPGKVASLGAGLALATPLGQSRILMGLERAGMLRTAGKNIVTKSQNNYSRALLQRLLTRIPAQAASNVIKSRVSPNK